MKFFRSRLFGFLMAIVLACSGLMLWSASSDQPTVFARALGAVVTPVQNTLSGAVDSENQENEIDVNIPEDNYYFIMSSEHL